LGFVALILAITACRPPEADKPKAAKPAPVALQASLSDLYPNLPKPGQPAPPFTARLLDGEPIDLKEELAKNKVVMLDFWATWCPPCIEEIPVLAAVARDYRDRGVS